MTKVQQQKLAKRLIDGLWEVYSQKITLVSLIQEKINSMGEAWSEDHIAFRTLPGKNCGSQILQWIFEKLGYVRMESMRFEDKKLNAFWMQPSLTVTMTGAEVVGEHLDSIQVLPKIFISELDDLHFDISFKTTVLKYTENITEFPFQKNKPIIEKIANEPNYVFPENELDIIYQELLGFFTSRPAWKTPSFADFEILRAQSEYAAWTLAYGNIPNHFTVSVHLMNTFPSLKKFEEYISENLSISMNTSGGVIKGSPEFQLEQCSTLAEEQLVRFSECSVKIPYAFVEFAFRFPKMGRIADGNWHSYYQGFVVSNADKIFESTNVKNGK